jgi:TetR/AcrR family transcriptional regulator, regulator of cefoperazone and chloramphenicol sensitivity
MASADAEASHSHAVPRHAAAGGEATRDKLIAAAGRVFAERGYHSATVREICKRAGANVAAVNYHFGDKLGLYTEVLQQSVRAAQVAAVRDAFERGAPPEQTLRAVIRARLRSVTRHDLPDWHVGIMAHELARPTPAMTRILDTVSRPLYERMLELVGTILGAPLTDPETRLCAHSIMGQIFLYALAGPVLARLSQQPAPGPRQMDRIADHIADFSLAYLRQAAATRRPKNRGNAAPEIAAKRRRNDAATQADKQHRSAAPKQRRSLATRGRQPRTRT